MKEPETLVGEMLEPEPQRVGRYELLAGVSSGGTSELYLAATRGPGGFRRHVALKRLLGDVQRDPGFVRMFLDEARITALLTHPGIAQVFDLGEDEGELYLVMEFIAGLDLGYLAHAARKAGQPLPIGLSCRLVRDLCLALYHAHAFVDPWGRPSPVIHRDISPKNVMVTFDGHVKVIDFGFALARDRLEKTAVGTIKGTVGYLSPEQVTGKPLDGRTDLYSAAVILYELLTGQRAFGGTQRMEVLEAIVQGRLAPARELNPDIPPAIEAVLQKALCRHRRERFEHGRDMARALHLASGNLIYDEARTSEFMRETFKEKAAQIRALFADG